MTIRRKLLAVLLVQAMLGTLPAVAQPNAPERLKAQLRELHSAGKEVKVTLSDGSALQGRIIRMSDHSFTVRPKGSPLKRSLSFGEVTDLRKAGSGRRKAILIPVAIAGATVLVLCAAPYPIGFLCHKDPS